MRRHLACLWVLAFSASACASAGPAARDPLTRRPGGLTAVLASLGRGQGLGNGSRGRYEGLRHGSRRRYEGPRVAVRARVEQALGHDADAARSWFEVADSSAALRSWASLHLLALSERVPIDATWLARARRHPDLAALAETLALKLQDHEALREARGRLGTGFRWARSARLLRYPGRTDSPPLGAGRFSDAFTSSAGFIASPEEGPGLYAFELHLPPGAHLVEVDSECALRAFVGPQSVARHEALEALLPERVSFPIELKLGETLQLHLVSRTAIARARVFVRAPEARPGVGRSDASDLAPLGTFGDFAAFELALAARDIDLAHRHAARLPAESLFARLASASLAVVDPTRAPERARTAAKATLEAALELEPAFVEARALLTRLRAEDQEHDPRAVDTADADTPAATRADLALRTLPRSCRARGEWLDAAWDRLRLHPDEVVRVFDEPLPPLPGPCLEARLRAVELTRDAFDLDGAERLLTPLLAAATATDHGLDPGPERARAEILAAQNALARGTWAPAAEHARHALALGGADAFARELLGRAERLQGGPPMPRLDPTADLGLPLTAARGLILAHLRKPAAEDGREVLLDDRFVRVNADGSLRIRVHRIVRVNDVAAVESVGELPIPDDAEILFVRTWKAAKHKLVRSLEPEDILEKATVSLPNLAPGDFAEWAYFYPLAASSRLTPGWRAPPYAFDSDQGPVTSARYALSIAPGARTPVFIVDPRVRPPERPDPSTWVFTAKALPRVFGEPGDPLPEQRKMTLLASSGIERLPLADALAAEIAFATRSSPTLAAMVAEALEGLPVSEREAHPEQLLRALYDLVRESVDEPAEATPFGVEASWVAERRRGSRALLLTALCRAAGLACELVLARPLWEGPEPRHADLDGLSYPLVRWAPIGRAPRWLDPVSRWMPFGLLPPALEGVFGLSLGAASDVAPSLLETPAQADPAHWGERKVAMMLTLDPDGAGVVALGSERIDGVFAASWRVALVAMNAEARQRILGSIVQQAMPNAVIESVQLDHLEDDSQPLTWSWRARTPTVPADGVSERGARAIQLALFPEGLTRDTVLLPTRETPLLVNRAARMSLALTVLAPAGWALVRAPTDQDLVYDLGRFERRSRYEQLGRAVVVDKRFVLRPGVIEPARYAAWSDAAVAIDRFDVVQIVAAPTHEGNPEP